MKEIWKSIEFSSKYEISNLGRLRTNFDKYKHIFTDEYRIIDGTIDPNGYKRITLRDKEKMKNTSFHRLVLETFKPIKNMEQLQVNHINWNRSDNRLENLEWVTAKENMNKKRPRICYNSHPVKDNNGKIFDSYRKCAEYHHITQNAVRWHIRNKNKIKRLGNEVKFFELTKRELQKYYEKHNIKQLCM